MTTPASDEPEPTTFAEWRAMQKRQDQRIELPPASQEHTAEMAPHNTRESAGIHAAYTRTAQDLATLKNWGLEYLCERRPELFADAFNLRRIDLLPKTEIVHIAADAEDLGIITRQQRAVVAGADVYFYGLRRPDNDRVCLVTQVSFEVGVRDVERAVRQAGILNEIIRRMRPFPITGMALPVVAGTRQSEAAIAQSEARGGVAFVPIYNGDSLMS